MKVYTSKTQKIELYSKKYNKTKEEINRILSEHEDMLTFEELKIKYDNPNIGKLPDWLDEESLHLMIWKTIHTNWNELLASNTTKEDLYMECQEYVRKKIALFENFNHLKASLVLRIRTVCDEYARRAKYFIGSLDETYETSDCSIKPKYEPSTKSSMQYILEENDRELVIKIKELKNKSAQQVLIIIGYLICGINALRYEYLQLLRESDEDIQRSIKIIESELYNEEDIKEKLKYTSGINKYILDIAKALKLDVIKQTATNTTNLRNLKKFLINQKVLDILTC